MPELKPVGSSAVYQHTGIWGGEPAHMLQFERITAPPSVH